MKSINKLLVVLGVAWVLFASQLGATEHGSVINVSTVEQMYAAVNNGNNVGATIHLAPVFGWGRGARGFEF